MTGSGSLAGSRMRKVPVLLLTLAALSPTSLSAPAPSRLPEYSKNVIRRATLEHIFARDSDAQNPPSPPRVTPFFTPAVFHKDYYNQTPVIAAAPEPTPAPLNGAFMDPAATEISVDPSSPTSTANDVDSNQEQPPPQQPTSEQPIQAAQETTPAPGANATPTPTPQADVLTTSSSSVAEVSTHAIEATTPLAAPTMTSTPTLVTEHATSLRPSITKFMAPPAVSSIAPPTGAQSERTQQSRKAAIIGTLLALGSIAALVFCVFCMRLPQAFRRRLSKRSIEDHVEELNDDKDMDPEKSFGNLGYQDEHLVPAQRSAAPSANGAPVVPLITASSPPLSNTTPANTPQNAWDPQWDSTEAAQEESPFEDVTHILTDEATFAPQESDSDTSRTSTTTTEVGSDRKSRGAVSLTHSYATCESRYSSPSVQDAADVSIADEQSASFHSAQSRSPSPPQTPGPVTPKTPHEKPSMDSPKRPRSKTLNEEQTSPIKKSSMSSSKSFPARYSNRSSEHSGKWSVLEQDSEWDIAAHYGARYSNRHSANPELGIASENMETIEIGGRNCVLVQG